MMARLYTIDASVFLNAFFPHEAGHETSHALLLRLQEQATPLILPTLLLPEVAAAIGRIGKDARLAQQFTRALSQLPHLLLVALDETLAHEAAGLAAQRRLRGSDAVYATVAHRFGSALVTLDRQQRERAAAIVPALSPEEALAELS